MSTLGVDPAKDAADDLRRLLITAGVILGAFSIGAATQSVFVYSAPQGVPSLVLRTAINLLSCAIALALCAWLRFPRYSLVAQIPVAVTIAFFVAFLRHGLQLLLGVYSRPTLHTAIVELVSAAGVVILALALGVTQMRSQARVREHERALAEQRLRATAALAALSEEELRVRRTVAENLHGGLQGRLVMVGVQLDRILEHLRSGALDDDDRETLERVRNELDTLREQEVRQVSHLLYPAGVDTSLAYALMRLVRRIPPQIEVETHIDDAFELGEETADASCDTIVVWRVALLRAAEEAISNALLHGGASRIGVRLEARKDERDQVVLIVDDDGTGMPDDVRQRGLALSAERLKRLGGSQRIEHSPWGGVRLIAQLPLQSRHPLSSA